MATDDGDDIDREAILRRRSRLIALALGGLALASAPASEAQPDAAVEDGGPEEAMPEVCLCAVTDPGRR